MAKPPYDIRLAPAAARQLRKLDKATRKRAVAAVEREARRAAVGATGQRGGKSVKALRGRADGFFRLRIGDYRAIYDLLDEERVLLVLGVINRRDLERWLRGR
jgi:mRNA interferase RelE/StbE